MSRVDLIDEMFVVAAPSSARAALCDEALWKRWFPDLQLTAYEDRGKRGIRWNVSGALVGTAEVWLEEFGDGIIVHTYLRCEPVAQGRVRTRGGDWSQRHFEVALKARLLAVKDDLEAGRRVGEPRTHEPNE